MLNQVVQDEPATALDPELMGPIAAIGIVKGKPFAPDERMRKILNEAAAVGNATSRSLFMAPRASDWYYYPGSAWSNFLFVSGYEFETPIPMITPEGVKPFPATGYRTLDARSAFFYGITGITPAMAMRLPGIGSQYLLAFQDAGKQFFDGSKTYKVTLPKGIPEAKFWSLTVYDNQTRSMLATPQRYPRAGSQSFPSPAAEADASGVTTVYFGPKQPAGVSRGNWIQTTPGKGWFVILRLYSPLEPFFDKSWRPSENRTGQVIRPVGWSLQGAPRNGRPFLLAAPGDAVASLQSQRSAVMNSMLQVANGILWAAAIVSSALMRAPWFLTAVLLPCLGFTAVMLAYISQRSTHTESRSTDGPA